MKKELNSQDHHQFLLFVSLSSFLRFSPASHCPVVVSFGGRSQPRRLLLLLDELHAAVRRYRGRRRLLYTTVASHAARTLNICVVQELVVVDLIR